ncbi:MAG: heat-inducible transcriptional repressor HrcA [Alphaproteobacteria bacterium]|nr:heat-inducible transcriptional repressor HrcA [Alphaproteobacteria bacterium]
MNMGKPGGLSTPLQVSASQAPATIAALNDRSREVFREIVEAYVATGEPVGSRTLSRRLGVNLSPATIRNVMSDLQDLGLLYAPHTSAGRLPTAAGLRLFVDGLLEVGSLSEDERATIDAQCAATGRSLPQTLQEATAAVAGLSRCASLVLAPKSDDALKHVEFVSLGSGRALVVLVTNTGQVENRVIEVPAGLTPAQLVHAGNFLNNRLSGRTLGEAKADVLAELREHRATLDELSRQVVEAGLAIWSGDKDSGTLIVRGQARLLEDVTALENLERIRGLFETLETRETMIKLLDAAQAAEGVRIYLGSENALFDLAGCSLVIAPYRNSRAQIVGAIGVIGPQRLNYARIIPMVDYTARVIGRLLG